jgi:hypothetical protein
LIREINPETSFPYCVVIVVSVVDNTVSAGARVGVTEDGTGDGGTFVGITGATVGSGAVLPERSVRGIVIPALAISYLSTAFSASSFLIRASY